MKQKLKIELTVLVIILFYMKRNVKEFLITNP